MNQPPIQLERPYALSIAGLDPCGGAGLLADIKVFEANAVYGLSVCTALTMQHDAQFRAVNWVPLATLMAQCAPLIDRYPIQVVKIGLIESLPVLAALIDWLTDVLPGVQLIWDPILKASAGFVFHNVNNPVSNDQASLTGILSRLTLLTPNAPEALQLAAVDQPLLAAKQLSQFVPVYLKGGHTEPRAGTVTDYLLSSGSIVASFPAAFIPNGAKHGSGCVLSSAIAAGLAKGLSLEAACAGGRQYMSHYLASTPTLLGFHPSL